MMTMNRRSDKLGRSIHPEGGLHDLSRERTHDRASTQADSARPCPLSGAGPDAGCRCGHGGEVALAYRCHRLLQPPTPVAEGRALGSRSAAGLAAEGLV